MAAAAATTGEKHESSQIRWVDSRECVHAVGRTRDGWLPIAVIYWYSEDDARSVPPKLRPFVGVDGARRVSSRYEATTAKSDSLWEKALAEWPSVVAARKKRGIRFVNSRRWLLAEAVTPLDALFEDFRRRVSRTPHTFQRAETLHFRQWLAADNGEVRAPMEFYFAGATRRVKSSRRWKDIESAFAWAAVSYQGAAFAPEVRVAGGMAALARSMRYVPDAEAHFPPGNRRSDDWQYPPRLQGVHRGDCEDLALEAMLCWPPYWMNKLWTPTGVPADVAMVTQNYRPFIVCCELVYDDDGRSESHATCMLLHADYLNALTGNTLYVNTSTPALIVEGTRYAHPLSVDIPKNVEFDIWSGQSHAHVRYGTVTDVLVTELPKSPRRFVGAWLLQERGLDGVWRIGVSMEALLTGASGNVRLIPGREYAPQYWEAVVAITRGLPWLPNPRVVRLGPIVERPLPNLQSRRAVFRSEEDLAHIGQELSSRGILNTQNVLSLQFTWRPFDESKWTVQFHEVVETV